MRKQRDFEQDLWAEFLEQVARESDEQPLRREEQDKLAKRTADDVRARARELILKGY